MYKITQLDNNPKQKIKMLLEDGSEVVLKFEYIANQQGWFFGFQYGDVNYQNIRLTTSLNLLRAYRNWLPFGIRCSTVDGFEPMDLDDFLTDYASVYMLTKEDINTIESEYYTKLYDYPKEE